MSLSNPSPVLCKLPSVSCIDPLSSSFCFPVVLQFLTKINNTQLFRCRRPKMSVFLFYSFLHVKPTNSSSHTDISNLVSSLVNPVLGGTALDELVSGSFSGGSEFGAWVNLIDSACNCGVNLKCEDRQGKFVVDIYI